MKHSTKQHFCLCYYDIGETCVMQVFVSEPREPGKGSLFDWC